MAVDKPIITSVYLICSEIDGALRGPCRVGISSDPDKRLRQVQTGSPHKLTVAFALTLWDRKFAQRVEAAFHACYSDARMNGEWFNLTATEGLRGLVEVTKIGFDWLLAGSEDTSLTFQSLADISGLMAAAELLYGIYESQGMLTTQQGGAVH